MVTLSSHRAPNCGDSRTLLIAGLLLVGSPVIVQNDADIVDHGHTLAILRWLGGGVTGDQERSLPQSRLAILPGTSHTAIPGQADLLRALFEPSLDGKTPKGRFN